ncbi:PilZ domain-containing protein [Sporolactobacillus spathodeae]|uniref:Cellulose synthase (UDP-forming) n=1 Tax=Sporolactobacillus spathodeae TaxID=1465502 RepID=A0ABS2QC73_9BACL|nr:PilZ domain-containing protein [Sporolactobacillus spathodeae]MBM7659216.1 cellulose synthase (UDP-forming) [Sporolactobacillus spathodeae]
MIYWFFGIFKTIYILAPLAFLLLGIYSLQTNLISVLTFWLPSFFGSYLSFRIVSKGKRSMIWSHIYDTSMAPHLALSALMELLFIKQLRFKVTPKGAQSGKRQFQLATVLPHLILAALTLLAFGKIAVDYLVFHRVDWQLVSVNLFWALYNLLGLIVSVMTAVNQPRFRRAERFKIEREAELQFASGESHTVLIHDLNEFGARLQGTRDSFSSISEQLTLHIANIGPITGRRVWVAVNKETVSFAMKFDALSAQRYTDLVNYTFNENGSRRSAIEKGRPLFLAISFRFIRQAFRVLTPHQHGEVRGKVNEEAVVTILPNQRLDRAAYEAAAALASGETTSLDRKVILVDLSAGGCQIQSSFPIELKAKLLIYSAETKMNGREAEAVWSKPTKGGYLTGLRFLKHTDRAELAHNRLVF